MTVLIIFGWAVIHSLWLCSLVGGATAMTLAMLPDRRARARHAIACTGLGLMVAAPIVVVATSLDPLTTSARQQVSHAIDSAISMPTFVSWRAVAVPSAGILWLAGLAVCVVRFGREWRRAAALRQRDLSDVGTPVKEVVASLCAELAIKERVNVSRSRRASVPMVLGWRRPVILLPAGTADDLQPEQLRAVLAHELAHVRRRDYLANLLQTAAETLLFHHPAARWVSHRVRTEREYCCDDVAVRVAGDADGYARALAALEDARDGSRLAVAAASGTLLDRIQRVVGHPRPMLTPARGVLVLVAASLVAAIFLALAAVVPPSIPLDAKIRTRNRVTSPGGAIPTPPPGSLPRTKLGS